MPDWAREVRARLQSLTLPPTRENEIVDELSQHLDDRWRELIAGGIAPDEAARLALAQFSSGDRLARYLAPLRLAHPTASLTPGAAAGSWLGDLRQDLRYGLRNLGKHRGFTTAAVLTLALGLGSNTAIFSVINAVLLQPLPFPNSRQLVAVYSRYLPSTGYDFPFFALSGPEFADIRGRVEAFSAIAAYATTSRNLTRADGEVERVVTMAVTADFFSVLGVPPARGRTFTESEAQRREGCVAVLGHSAAAPNAIGATIRLDDRPCEVIGVMPEGFGFLDDRVRVWTPLRVDLEETDSNRGSHPLLAIARRRDGVSVEQADAQLQSLRQYWSEKYPDHYAKGHFAVSRSLHEDIAGDQREALVLLGGAVLAVLLIICVNLAALLVSHGETRRREFAVRHALGADRRRLIRQLLAEALLLAAIGGVVGVMLANVLLDGLIALYPARLPVWQPIVIDYAGLLYISGLVVAAGVLVGLMPAFAATGTRIQAALGGSSRAATASRRSMATRAALVISQLALSVILLVGALLLIRSYQRLQQVDLGINPDHVLTFTLSVPPGRVADAAAARRTLAAIEARLAATPGVDVAGAISNLPLVSAGPPDDFVIEGRATPGAGAPAWNGRYLMTTPRTFRTLGIPLKRGRMLDEGDGPGQPLVAVINETAARTFWPGDDPVGRTIRYYPQETSPSIRIVGIVGDVRSLGASMPAPPAVYVPFEQAPRPAYEGRTMTFIVRVPGNPATIVPSARAAVAAIDDGLPLANVRAMTEVVSGTARQPRFTALVMALFAGVAFGLAALGLFGVLAYTVEQRRREIGVRVALGADKRQIFGLILRNGMLLALSGVSIGVPAAWLATRWMGSVLSGVSGTDPLTYLAVFAMVATSALLASYLPARRATRVDPLVALRTE